MKLSAKQKNTFNYQAYIRTDKPPKCEEVFSFKLPSEVNLNINLTDYGLYAKLPHLITKNANI